MYNQYDCKYHQFISQYIQIGHAARDNEQEFIIQIGQVYKMNYHFKPGNKKEQLLSQLQQLDSDLKKDNNSLQRLKLEAEFYEDKAKPPINKESLADQIMKELISDPYKPRYQPPNPNQQQPQYIPASPKHNNPLPFPKQPPQVQRENNFINERELQKNKLQNQKHEGLFPNSSDHNRIRSYGKQAADLIPEKDKSKSPRPTPQVPLSPRRRNSPEYPVKFDPSYNPFVRDDAQERRLKEQKNRQYLRALQEQRLEQERQKKNRLKEEKEIKVEIFNNYQPQPKNDQAEKPIVMKKNDPNSKPPKVEPIMGNFSQFDRNLIKSKVIELRIKFKKGKIIYEEYERELNNLRKQYAGDFEELLEDDHKKEPSPPYQKIQSPKKNIQDIKYEPKFIEQPKAQPQNFPIRNESINYSQFMPSMVQPQQHQNYTGPNQAQNQNYIAGIGGSLPAHIYGMIPPPSYYQGAPPPEYMQLLKKMFDFCFNEVKQVRNEQANQNHVLQETLNKFLAMSAQPNLMTQQIPAIPSAIPKDFYSDSKQHREYFQREKQSNAKKKVPISNESLDRIPFGQSDNSQFYDKSLSAIASKIPLNQRVQTKEDDKAKQSVLDQFYSKKYKVKPLGRFNILIDPNQSQTEIPSTSSYLRAKNAKEELKYRFEQDLKQLKMLQSDKNFRKFASKMQGNTSYRDQRINKEPKNVVVSSAPFPETTTPKARQYDSQAFLKKYKGNQDNNILTFNENELKINSPSGYSPVSKKEILEQDEYQTEPRVKEQPKGASSLIQEYEEKLAQPNKALNFIKMNNQFLSKYQYTQPSQKSQLKGKDSEFKYGKQSKDYFTNNDISPVKAAQNYQESMETIRSQFQSARPAQSKRLGVELVSPAHLQPQQNVQFGYSQTVQSVQESSSRYRKPPIAKKRSVGKKKQSSISRSKVPFDSSASHNSRKSKDDSFDPQHPKFDSNVYESQYQESVDLVRPGKIPPQIVINHPKKQEERQSQIQLNPPTWITPKAAQQAVEPSEISQISSKAQSKWKSLEEARKLAKQCRQKVDDSKQYRSVEQKFSQLQSFMTKRGDESEYTDRKAPYELIRSKTKSKQKQGSKQKTPKKGDRKNIMKLLQDLQQEEDDNNMYKQEFESYREQSEHYQ